MEETLLNKLKTKSSNPSLSCKLIQKQVTHELENERLYLEMASWCSHKGLTQTAHFFALHSLEERKHAMDFVNHMLMQGKRILFGATMVMKQDYKDLTELLTESLEREKETSAMIQCLFEAGQKENNSLIELALYYITEQKEEEQLFLSLLTLWKTCEGSKIDFEMEVMKLKCDNETYKLGKLPTK